MKQNDRILIALLLIMSYTLRTEPLDTVWSENNGIKCNQSWLPNWARSNRAFNALRCPQETMFWLANGNERGPFSSSGLVLMSWVTSPHQASLPFSPETAVRQLGLGMNIQNTCASICTANGVYACIHPLLIFLVFVFVVVVGDVLNSHAHNKRRKITCLFKAFCNFMKFKQPHWQCLSPVSSMILDAWCLIVRGLFLIF